MARKKPHLREQVKTEGVNKSRHNFDVVIALPLMAYLVACVEGIVHESCDNRSFANSLISKEDQFVLGERDHICRGRCWR